MVNKQPENKQISSRIMMSMMAYDRGSSSRIAHFVKVFGYAQSIAEQEQLDHETCQIVEAAALTHDIGIKVSMQKYNSGDGKYQQIEGPPEARELLGALDLPQALIERVCWLIAHHHDYASVTEIDHRILIEADFLVNGEEGKLPKAAIIETGHRIFSTGAGRKMLEEIFDVKL